MRFSQNLHRIPFQVVKISMDFLKGLRIYGCYGHPM